MGVFFNRRAIAVSPSPCRQERAGAKLRSLLNLLRARCGSGPSVQAIEAHTMSAARGALNPQARRRPCHGGAGRPGRGRCGGRWELRGRTCLVPEAEALRHAPEHSLEATPESQRVADVCWSRTRAAEKWEFGSATGGCQLETVRLASRSLPGVGVVRAGAPGGHPQLPMNRRKRDF